MSKNKSCVGLFPHRKSLPLNENFIDLKTDDLFHKRPLQTRLCVEGGCPGFLLPAFLSSSQEITWLLPALFAEEIDVLKKREGKMLWDYEGLTFLYHPQRYISRCKHQIRYNIPQTHHNILSKQTNFTQFWKSKRSSFNSFCTAAIICSCYIYLK